ncbi:MAG: DNA polymerase domain-containing protein [Candidatus Bathyarchaeota archaeon]
MKDWKRSFVKLKTYRGWLFDVYPSNSEEMTVWIISEDGERIRLIDKFNYRIYVSGKPSELKGLERRIRDKSSVASLRFVEKHSDPMEVAKRKVLEINVTNYRKTPSFARKILEFGGYGVFRLHNVDIPISQAYFYEKDIFPLAQVVIVDNGKNLCYNILDSVESLDYVVPPFRSIWLDVGIKKKNVPQRFSDKIKNISLRFDNETIIIDKGNEVDKILKLTEIVKREDPDLIFTRSGDSFLFPYLAHRAFINSISNLLVLSRENIPLKAEKREGRTFFSYGRTYHKAPTRRLYGRIHIDVKNTFIYSTCGLEGLVEVSRTCRVPLHRAARASIGSIMSSLQLYTAWKDDILIPWKKREPENFKSAWELLVADRGGFLFEPKLGFHKDVLEVDFTSMFPILMQTRNISAETVLCKCCPNSGLRVPELDYYICERRRGIVPKTLDLLLKKRLRYKGLMREAICDKEKQIYRMRQAALKWILVTCFGYLGYRNARFGKVDAHIATCAFARDALLKTARRAEEQGFDVIHGIVDSLWLKKPAVAPKEIAEFCIEASSKIKVPLSFEGKYRWIVFLPSKVLENIPVLNRYYGVFEDSNIKMRGIEARRSDTSHFIRKAQVEMIKKLAKARNFQEFLAKIPSALDTLRKFSRKLVSHQVDPQDLLITKRLSKSPSGYTHSVLQAIAAKQLEQIGFQVSAGQEIQYLIVNSKSKNQNERVLITELLQQESCYDVQKYLQMLLSAGETLLGAFGYTQKKINEEVFCHKETEFTMFRKYV